MDETGLATLECMKIPYVQKTFSIKAKQNRKSKQKVITAETNCSLVKTSWKSILCKSMWNLKKSFTQDVSFPNSLLVQQGGYLNCHTSSKNKWTLLMVVMSCSGADVWYLTSSQVDQGQWGMLLKCWHRHQILSGQLWKYNGKMGWSQNTVLVLWAWLTWSIQKRHLVGNVTLSICLCWVCLVFCHSSCIWPFSYFFGQLLLVSLP